MRPRIKKTATTVHRSPDRTFERKGGERSFSKKPSSGYSKGPGSNKPYRDNRVKPHSNSQHFRSAQRPVHKPVQRPVQPPQIQEETGPIRLNRFIANSGICSRREADQYIIEGLITVNGQTITELGVKVQPGDDVRFNGQRLRGEQKVYLLMNKPKDYVTTVSDPHAEKNVMQLISKSLCPQRVFPVGRLDKNTTGVLLLTNDGELAEKLTHPSYQKKKIYQVTLDKKVTQEDLNKLVEGIHLSDGPAHADEAAFNSDSHDVVGIEIHSGRNRIVRRMFEALGYRVRKLDRVYFAGLTKKNLRRGQWRFLSEEEVTMIKLNFYE